MKKFSYETYLGVVLLAGLLLLFTKGIKRAEDGELNSVSQNTVSENAPVGASRAVGISPDEEAKMGKTSAGSSSGTDETPSDTETETTDSTPSTGKTVVLDPGHGGSDPGKIGINGSKEKDINLAISQALKDCLEEKGIRVVLTREDANGLYKESDSNKKQADMRTRCEIIDQAEAELTVSIHQNSYTAESVCGPQVFYHVQSAEGEKAAACLQEALNRDLEIARPREIKSNNTYYILKQTKTPVVIAECGFLSNYEEAEKLITSDYQKKVAEALCAGIMEYLETD